MKKLVIILVKLAVSLTLLTYLIIEIQRSDPQTFTRLQGEPKDWDLLAAGALCTLMGLTLGVVRWHLLIRALDLPQQLAATFRVGVLAYLFDYAALGAAGGDLVKMVLLSRAQPGRRARAIASIIADRSIGVSALIVTASVVTLWMPLSERGAAVYAIIGVTRLLAALAALCIVAVLVPRTTRTLPLRLAGGLPYVGPLLMPLIEAVRLYRNHVAVLVLACGLAAVSLGLNVTGIYLVAHGLPAGAPTWGEHVLIVPLTLMSGVIPLPAGLGVSDYTLTYLYTHVSRSIVPAGQGLLVTMACRGVGVAIAMVGVAFYLTSRRQVTDALHDASVMGAHDIAAPSAPSRS